MNIFCSFWKRERRSSADNPDRYYQLVDRLENRRWYDTPLWDGRVRAARQLGELGDPRAREPLAAIALERAPDGGFNRSYLAIQCTLALARLGDERAVLPLRQLMYEGEFEWFRQDAIKALGYISDRSAVDLLMALFVDPEDSSINELAAESLARLGKTAVRDLVSLLGEEDYRLYNPAKVALVKIGRPAVRQLAKALNSFNLHKRVRAFQVLEQIDSPEARAAVAYYLRRPDPEALLPTPPRA